MTNWETIRFVQKHVGNACVSHSVNVNVPQFQFCARTFLQFCFIRNMHETTWSRDTTIAWCTCCWHPFPQLMPMCIIDYEHLQYPCWLNRDRIMDAITLTANYWWSSMFVDAMWFIANCWCHGRVGRSACGCSDNICEWINWILRYRCRCWFGWCNRNDWTRMIGICLSQSYEKKKRILRSIKMLCLSHILCNLFTLIMWPNCINILCSHV